MKRHPWQKHERWQRDDRRGAAMVEFAIVAPLFLLLIVGTVEMGNALEASTHLSSALREAGRLAGMDWTGLLAESESPNTKIIRDIQNFMTAAGYPGDQIAITITSVEGTDEGQTFDLGNPDNEMRLFKIEASIPYEQVSSFPHGFMQGRDVAARLVMRAGRISLMN
ncbi:MAG: pilus assembly protein [Planctomycetaceae bacterium]|nr:pilus assembly protein [Planctomycetaceae bacterium]